MSTAPSKPTLDQRRAKHAWESVRTAKTTLKEAEAKKYGGQAKKLPMRIMSAGLGQALVFLECKKYAPLLIEHITDWIITQRKLTSHPASSLGDAIRESDANFLRRATDESLAYLQWLTRFAEAEGLVGDVQGD